MASSIPLHREDERLRSFKTWSIDYISSEELARTGFFYLCNTYDLTQCFFCKIILGAWDEEDDIVKEHLRWSPKCPLILRKSTNNVPLDWTELDRILPASVDQNSTWEMHSTTRAVRQIHAMVEEINELLSKLTLL